MGLSQSSGGILGDLPQKMAIGVVAGGLAAGIKL